MNELDWAIIIVLVLSTIVGVTRGVVREILSIVGWVIGIVFAIHFSPELAVHIPLESLGLAIRTIIAAVLICVLCVFAIGLYHCLMDTFRFRQSCIQHAAPGLRCCHACCDSD